MMHKSKEELHKILDIILDKRAQGVYINLNLELGFMSDKLTLNVDALGLEIKTGKADIALEILETIKDKR